jgi:hypothetical protein
LAGVIGMLASLVSAKPTTRRMRWLPPVAVLNRSTYPFSIGVSARRWTAGCPSEVSNVIWPVISTSARSVMFQRREIRSAPE